MEHVYIWLISFVAVAAVITRPLKIPEAVWAVCGAVLLVVLQLISTSQALTGVLKGMDVYLFLTGMMLLAETAREEKLFDWLAAHATRLAKGSPQKLFILIYLTGIIVTVFLSNDATAVVLTPAVAAAVKAANIKKPLPYLLICAFIANAASFVLPVSNPANLVIYGAAMPSLLQWLPQYILPSLAAIITTFFMLRYTQRKDLQQNVQTGIVPPNLSSGGRTALLGIIITAAILMVCSALDVQLGLPTAITGIITSLVVIIAAKKNPWIIIKGVSWQVLPLVAGLFVITLAISSTGLTQTLTHIFNENIQQSVTKTTWLAGLITAVACNLVNNLPAGLIAGNIVQAAHAPAMVKSAVLIGIDLGPNLSVTGSLATILWLVALRREGQTITAWSFLKLGALIMITALVAALAALWL